MFDGLVVLNREHSTQDGTKALPEGVVMEAFYSLSQSFNLAR